jgi:hypothetical protein
MALFSVDVFHHIVDPVPGGFLAKLLERLDAIMTTQAELQAALEALTAQTEKAKAEILDKIAALEAAIDNSDEVDQGVADAFFALKAAVQGVDDIVTDEQPEFEAPEPAVP